MRKEPLQSSHQGRQRHRCPRRRDVAVDGLQVQQGRPESRGPSKFPAQIYRDPLSVTSKAGDEERTVYLEPIDDEQIVILVYDDFISSANPSG
jgi:hypothetical protein